MRLSQAWIITSKDFATFRKRKNIIYSILVIPMLVSILLPLFLEYAVNKGSGGFSPGELTYLLPAFTFFYLVIAGLIPTTIASYSIVGEKVEKSIEPLLATPTTDGEILFGKGVAAFLPTVAAILGGSAVFMGLTDLITRERLGYNYFPNWNAGVILFLLVPLGVVMSVEWNVLVSSRVSDVRIGQQVGMLLVIPFVAIYVAGEINLVPLGDTGNLLMIVGALALLDMVLFFAARATFRREEILTKWR